jgi:hypothetical protein
MNPHVQVSWGELIDKVTILEIKSAKLTSEAALANVRRELAHLSGIAEAAIAQNPGVGAVKAQLRAANEQLWQIEDDIRAKEAGKSFDADFIALARAVYHTNDHRGRLKREIDRLLQSDFMEEKQYAKYE